MSDVKLQRKTRQVSITLGTSESSATPMRIDDMAGGSVAVGTMSTNATSLIVLGSTQLDGTFSRLYSSQGILASVALAPSTSESRVYALPDEVFAVPYVKIISGTTHSAGVSAVITFKS